MENKEKMNTAQAQEWMDRMHSACKANNGQLINGAWADTDDPKNHKERHLSFARDFGYALNDFDAAAQREILTGSYSRVYVRACNLKPALNAKEWISALKAGLKKAENYGKESG